MTLRVISAGVGRTGTFSMKSALELLGFGPCHHMEEVDATNATQVEQWQKAAEGHVDWAVNYAGYSSAVDWPTAAFWRELSAAFPSAKFLLTIREPESWYKSFSETIYPLLQAAPRAPDELKGFLRMVATVVHKTGFRIPSTKEDIIAAFNRHNETVKQTIPPHRLLVFDVKQGWQPLCNYLGVPVRDAPFPRTNNKEDFWASAQALKPEHLKE
jgi:hypothetical protein